MEPFDHVPQAAAGIGREPPCGARQQANTRGVTAGRFDATSKHGFHELSVDRRDTPGGDIRAKRPRQVFVRRDDQSPIAGVGPLARGAAAATIETLSFVEHAHVDIVTRQLEGRAVRRKEALGANDTALLELADDRVEKQRLAVTARTDHLHEARGRIGYRDDRWPAAGRRRDVRADRCGAELTKRITDKPQRAEPLEARGGRRGSMATR